MTNHQTADFDHYLKTALAYLFYCLFLFTPLVWLPNTSELFEFPKMILVYTITALVLGFWSARCLLHKKFIFARSPLDLPLLLFLASQLISTILSIHPRTSFFGYYSRFNGGLLSTISYLTLYYAFISNLGPKPALKSLSLILVSGLLASLYALPEHFGYSFSCLSIAPHQFNVACWVQDVQTRIFGTFGQPNWLAAYLVTLIPLTWACSLNQKLTNHLKLAAPYLYYATGLLFFAILIFTRSRSGLIAMVIAYFVFWLFLFLKTKFAHFKPFLAVSLGLAAIALIFGTEYTFSLGSLITNFNSSTAPASNSSTPSGTLLETGDISLPKLSGGGTESGKIREIVWTGAWNMARSHPFFGTGVETFAYSYYRFRPQQHNLVSEWDFLYNKAHNEFLNFAGTTGFIGLATYLLFIFAFLFILVKTLFAKQRSARAKYEIRPLASGLLAGYFALNITNFFGFSTVPTNLLFFLLPAIFFSLSQTISPPKTQEPSTQLSNLQLVGLFALLLATCYLLLGIGKMLTADLYYANAGKNERDNILLLALDQYQRAINLLPGEATFHNDYSNALSKLALYYAQQQDQPKTIDLLGQAFEESATTLRLNPVHLNFYKTQAGVYIRLSAIDQSLLEVAKTILQDATVLAPTDAKLNYNLGLIDLDLGDPESATRYFETAVDQKPNHEAARLELADLYLQANQTDKAIQQYQFILNYIAPGNSKVKQTLEELNAK